MRETSQPDDAVRPLTPAGPRHEFAPPPPDGRLGRTGVATPAERRRAVLALGRTVGSLAVAFVIAPVAAAPLGGVLSVDPIVVWLGLLAVTGGAPSAARRLAD